MLSHWQMPAFIPFQWLATASLPERSPTTRGNSGPWFHRHVWQLPSRRWKVEVIGQKKNTGPAFPDIEMVDVVRQVVPLRYTQRHTTPLAVEPEAEKNTTVNFELRSSDSR